MTTERYHEAWGSYRDALTRIYATDVQSLIATREPTEVERPEEPIDEALRSSQQLTDALGERLEGDGAEDRQLAALQLAAGADVDIGVAMDLARREEESLETMGRTVEPQALMAEARNLSLSFQIPEADGVLDARSLEEVPDVPSLEGGSSAEAETVENAIETAIAAIRDQAAAGGQDVVRGAATIGVPLGGALGAVAQGAIDALSEKVGYFVRKALAFLAKAIQKLLRLLGSDFTKAVADRLEGLLEDLENGDLLADVLKRIWDTDSIEAECKRKVTEAGDKLTEKRAGMAVDKLQQLQAAYTKQTGLVRKVLKGVAVLQGFVVHIQPVGPLVLGGGYAATLVFLTLSGADYVDWPRADLDGFFDRVDGVRHIVDGAVS